MTWGVALLLVLLALLLLLFCAPVYLELYYKREGKDDRLHLGVRALFGLVKLGYEMPVVHLLERSGRGIRLKKEPAKQMPKQKRGWVTWTIEEIEHFIAKMHKVRERIGKYERAIRKLTKAFHIESFKWRTMFGTGDAAQTATITGLAWALKGIIGSYIYRFFTVEQRLWYDVKPHFQAKGFRTELRCIIRIRPGEAMFAGITLAILYVKEGIKWRIIRFKA